MRRERNSIMISGVLIAVALIIIFSVTAHAAPVQAPIIGEIEGIAITDINDPWSGGTIVVGGQSVTLPRNLLIDLPANRLTLKQIFDQAPAACIAAGETGLAKGDSCNTSGTGGFATIAANVTNAGNIIAGDVFIQKGIESVTGLVTYINYTDGYLRVNGDVLNTTQADDNTGVMIRINDPTGRHTVQQGLGCLIGALNCSADPRFTLDPDNYVISFTTGYPACVPSMVSRTFVDILNLGTTTAQGLANGTGDVLCPATNRSINGGMPVDDSRRFAPIQLGDHITATGNFETINCTHFISANSLKVSKQLATKNSASQPDYMFIEQTFREAPGFQDQFIQSHFFGSTTRSPADVVIWSVHNDPVANQPHEFLLATTLGCDAAAGVGSCTAKAVLPAAGVDIFSISHIVNFRILPTARLFDPCAHFRADSRFIPLNVCPAGGTFAEQFSMLSPMPRQIHARTGHKLLNPGLITLDVRGNSAPNGQYYFQMGIGLASILLPDFAGIDLNLLSTPISFSGIPWNLDRRLSPGGCLPTGCELTPQPLDPFPFEGIDPRIQAATPTGPYIDPNFNRGILSIANNRVLSYVSGTPVGGLFNFDGNNTILSWPPADPVAFPVPVIPPIVPQLPVVSITSFPGFTATQDILYGYQVTASNPSEICGGLIYSLDVNPPGMTVSALGLIQWTPTLAQVGPNPVTIRVTDPMGYFDIQSFVIVAVGAGPDKIGVFSNGLWNLDMNGNGIFDGAPGDRTDVFGLGLVGAVPVTGDWNGTGTTKIGIYADGLWYLDINGNGAWNGEPTDKAAVFGVGLTNAVPVTGDWNGTGTTKIGIYADGLWYLDINGNGAWDGEPIDRIVVFGAGLTGAIPVTGNWTGGAATNVGVYLNGSWYLDMNGNGAWDGEPTDKFIFFGVGLPGAIPVTGDWNGSGSKKVGVFVDGTWYLDFNGNWAWDPAIDIINIFGSAGQNPVSGRLN